MCEFFSCVSDGKGTVYYFDAEMRRKIIAGETEYQDTDSHTSIAHWYGFRGRDEDSLNKYEYNPLTGKFTIDQLNTTDDSERVKTFCKALDFSTIVPRLVIKPIVYPLHDIVAGDVREAEIGLLKTWASVGDSVRTSVWDSVGDSVRASVWTSVWAYISSFFIIEKWKYIDHEPGQNPFQPCINLWERGLVPSFDGQTWRLHAGPSAKIVYEWTPSDERK